MNTSMEDARITRPMILKLGAIYQMNTGVMIQFVGVDREEYIFSILKESEDTGQAIFGARKNLQLFCQRNALKLIKNRGPFLGPKFVGRREN